METFVCFALLVMVVVVWCHPLFVYFRCGCIIRAASSSSLLSPPPLSFPRSYFCTIYAPI